MAEASGGTNEDTKENFDLDTSRNLNSILNDLGLTKKSISDRRDGMQVYNLTLHVPFARLPGRTISYVSGSTVEGVASVADKTSDIDIMMISPINVINAIDQIDNQVKHFPIQNGVYVLEDSISHCLYKRLRFMAGENMEVHYHHTNGYKYLSHDLISDACHNYREFSEMLFRSETLPNNIRNLCNLWPLSKIENCGPSMATSHEFGGGSVIFDADSVWSIFCPFWPNEISDFFVRHRQHEWPTPRDLDLIIGNGCHLVGKGFERSMECQIEWRLSFSFAENILIRSLNNIQMKCYFLLKKFLKINIKPRFPKLLCSYHMKTVIFWVCEEIGPIPFKKEFLLTCFRLCIERIGSYLLEGHFPCYFARESNLLSETVPREEYRKVAEFVSIVYHEETITTFVSYLKGDSQIFKHEFLPKEKMFPLSTSSLTLKFAMETCIEIGKRKSTKEIQSYLNCTIFEIIEKSLFHAYPDGNIFNVLRQIIFPDIAFTAIALSCRRQIRNKVHYTLQKHYLQLMTNELVVTYSKGLLKRATVYYKTGQFTRCMVIVVNVINLITATNALRLGVHLEEIINFSCQLLFRRYTVPCENVDITPIVTFSELDKPLVPDFIIEEINFVEHINGESTKGWAFLDPVIYAYGLAIICQHEQSDFPARDQFLQDLQHFFLQNKHRIGYQNSAKRIIDHFIGQFCRQGM